MKRIENVNVRGVRTQGIVRDDGTIPHVHCVIPAGGLSLDHQRWVHPRYAFFLPVKVLSRVFRGKFTAGLKRAFRKGQLVFPGSLQPLANERAFRSFLRPLFRQDWVVYAKPPFGGPQHVLHYLARYTHRVAISNHRIVDFTDGQVTFRWKDYAHGSKQKLMTVTADEFLRRFLLHVLPHGFVRIRFFGSSQTAAENFVAALPATAHAHLRVTVQTASARSLSRADLALPSCGESMILVQRFTAVELNTQQSAHEGSTLTARNCYPLTANPTVAPAPKRCVCSHLPFTTIPRSQAACRCCEPGPPPSAEASNSQIRPTPPEATFETSQSVFKFHSDWLPNWPRPPQTRSASFKWDEKFAERNSVI